MKPRQLAELMVVAMNEAAARVWGDNHEKLEVENKAEGKKWVWDYVQQRFSSGPKRKEAE